MFRPLLTLLTLALSAGSTSAHEFWIDPEAHAIGDGDQIVANLRVGQEYKGSAYVYNPRNFRVFDVAHAGMRAPVEGRMGDRPAAAMMAPGDGLVTLIHETVDYTLTYSEFADFVSFVEHKDADAVIAEHGARDLPDAGFKEVYSRYAKALVGVGEASGDDIVAGLETEIVALENPYTDDMSDGIDVRLLYQGAPRAMAQIEVFEKSGDDSVVISTVTTDADGVATIPVSAGRRYMLDAVVLREPSAELAAETGAVWESLWANLTFAVPG